MTTWIIVIPLVIIALFIIIKQSKNKKMNFPPSTSGIPLSEIDRLEHTLNKKLPEYYKNFLMNYPDDLVKLGHPYNTVSELSLPNDADRLIEINEDESPPSNILLIGVNGLGDFYYLILDDNPKKVYEFPHDAPPFIDGDTSKIDWKAPWGYSDLNELIGELKETLVEEPLTKEEEASNQKELDFLNNFVVSTSIVCEMRDELLTNRNLETADVYPKQINANDVANSFEVEPSLFVGYPQDTKINYSFLVTVDNEGTATKWDYLGGDNMLIIDEVNKNIQNLQFENAVKNSNPVESFVLVNYQFCLLKS